jgi:hypothetical protein
VELHGLEDRARELRTGGGGGGAGELARVRGAAAANEELRNDAARWLSESYVEQAVRDLGAAVRANLLWHRGSRYCHDVEIEVPFEDDTGGRAHTESVTRELCARVLVVRRLVVDLAALTPDQVCAAYPFGDCFFPEEELEALVGSLTDMTRVGACPDLIVCAELPDWKGYRERTRDGVPRLLSVVASDDQIGQAKDAAGQAVSNWPLVPRLAGGRD